MRSPRSCDFQTSAACPIASSTLLLKLFARLDPCDLASTMASTCPLYWSTTSHDFVSR